MRLRSEVTSYCLKYTWRLTELGSCEVSRYSEAVRQKAPILEKTDSVVYIPR